MFDWQSDDIEREEGMMPTGESGANAPGSQEAGTWERVNSDDIHVGDRVRSTGIAGWGCAVQANEVTEIDDEYFYLAGSGGWDKRRSWERWVPAESPARDLPAWSPVQLSDLAVGDRVRATHCVDEGSVYEGVITALTCTMGTRPAAQVTGHGLRLCLHEGTYSFERQNPASGAGAERVLPAAEPAIPAEVWERVTDFSTLRAGDHLRSDYVMDSGSYGRIEGTFSRLSRNGRVMLDERPGAQYFTDGTRTWERRVTAPSEPMPMGGVVLAAPRVGDRFTRVFSSNFRDRPGCTVRTVREVGDAPGQTLWAITYTAGDGEVWANELLVRPDGTCNPNEGPTDRHGRDVTGRYVPEVVATPTFVPIPASEIREGMYVRGTSNRTTYWIPESVEGEVTYVSFDDDQLRLAEDYELNGPRELACRNWERRVTPEQGATVQPAVQQATGWVSVSDPSELRVGDVVRAEPNSIGGLMQAEVRDTWRSNFNARTLHVITPSRTNGRAMDQTADYYYGDILPFEVWRGVMPAPAPEQPTPATVAAASLPERGGSSTPLPDWATSLDAAKRHVHAEVQRLWTGRGGENCSGGSNDVLRGLSLPRVDQEYPAPPDETEEIRSFLAQVREVSLNVADRHGKSRRTVERWLEWNGIVEPPPALVTHTATFQAPADADVRQVLLGLGWVVQD